MSFSYRKPIHTDRYLDYKAKNAQVAINLLTSCNNLLQQADIRMRSHGLRQLVITSLLQVVNRLVASCQQSCCKLIISASYVGQTTRHLHTRISEHLGISPITGKHSTNPAVSSILSHTNAPVHPANFDDFQILSSSSDSYELMIHESLLINKYRPNPNVQGSSIPLNLF